MWTKVKKHKFGGRVKENEEVEQSLASETDQGSYTSILDMGPTFRKAQ